MIRFLTAGESHGRALVGILEGMPAGLAISEEQIAEDLRRRQLGYGRGERMKIEADYAQILAGVRYGKTLGSPLALLIENRDAVNWREQMRTDAPPENEKTPPLTTPRPGHADYAGAIKYEHNDIRNVIERSSARETAMRVALSAIGRAFFREFGIVVVSHVLQIGKYFCDPQADTLSVDEIKQKADASAVRCLSGEAETRMKAAIDEARERKDTVGGVFEVIVDGMPPGIGSYAHYDRRLDALLAGALISIPAIKAVSVGWGEDAARLFGSEVHDRMFLDDAKRGIRRTTNLAGGMEGGMSNGERIVLRATMKPLSTLGQPLDTVDLAHGEAAIALRERSDVCAVPAAAVVGEAVVLLALMNPFMEKFGGDSMTEIQRHFATRSTNPWA
jgi:chorismate synthase